MQYRIVILIIGIAFVIINFKDVVFDNNLFDYPKTGQLRLPNLLAFLLGVFIVLFYAWDWLKRKRHKNAKK